MKKKYDVVVIGAGHAGLEAAFICAKKNLEVALITMHISSVGMAPCNPSIGGPAKGIVTREIDILGGMQAKATDANLLQIKLLNLSKGPSVWALRAQIDKNAYSKWFLEMIKKTKKIDLIINEVQSLLVKNNKVIGVQLNNCKILCDYVIITSGTYLNSKIYVGSVVKNQGPSTLKNSQNLSENLKSFGFKLIRLKTGTPPRVKKNTINYKNLEIEPGSKQKLCFSHFDKRYLEFKEQVPCFLTYTNEKTHQIIQKNLKKSSMYSGFIDGVGPRYCPSIEDKIVRFYDKKRHQIFIEPESKELDTMYLQGLSTSLPTNVQDELVHSINGLEKAKIINYAYAIEYDALNPIQLWPTLESKKIKNLFFAGQINGTSGYEEAACQGLIAGINVYAKKNEIEPLILKRHESYIGVLIDDLVNKGVSDPYRLLTSRAEYRLLLRNDNADDRLMKYAKKYKLLESSKIKQYYEQKRMIESTIDYLKNTKLSKALNLSKKYSSSARNLIELLKRPEVKLIEILDSKQFKKLTEEMIQKIEISVKLSGYISNQKKQIEQFKNLENIKLDLIKNYKDIKNLSLEAIDKLNNVKPLTLDQAMRISGINLNDLMIIKYYVEHLK